MFKIKDLKLKSNNPRKVSDSELESLQKSIEEFPKMLELRPIIYDPNTMEVLAGNQRLKVLAKLGFKEIPENWLKAADKMTEEEKLRLGVVDNAHAGTWDFELLEQAWDKDLLAGWGVKVEWPEPFIEVIEPDIDKFFEDDSKGSKEATFKIVLEYTENDFNLVLEAFKKHSGSKESIIFKLLGL